MVSITECIKNDDDCNNTKYKKQFYNSIFNILAEKISSNIICCIAFNSSERNSIGECNEFQDNFNNASADIYAIIKHDKIDIIVIECHPLDSQKIRLGINEKMKGAGAEHTVEMLYCIIKRLVGQDEKIEKYYKVIENLRRKYRVFPIFLTNSTPFIKMYKEYIEAIL